MVLGCSGCCLLAWLVVIGGWFTCRRRCRWSRVAQAPARRNDLAPGDKEKVKVKEEEEEVKC